MKLEIGKKYRVVNNVNGYPETGDICTIDSKFDNAYHDSDGWSWSSSGGLINDEEDIYLEELGSYRDILIDKIQEAYDSKGHDYAGDDRFSNFGLCEYLKVTSTENGMFTRMCDKVSRVANYLRQQELKVTDESITDTLADLANYALLLAEYLHDKNNKDEK